MANIFQPELADPRSAVRGSRTDDLETENVVSAGLFEATKRWGRWGEDDHRGALNLLTPGRVTKAAALVRDGVTVPGGRPLATAPAVDNPNPALHHMIHAGDVAASEKGLQWAGDFVGVACHGNSVSHIGALCHVFVDGRMYNGAPATDVTSVGARRSSIEVAEDGMVGRGVLLDIPRLRGFDWLEPGDAIAPEELDATRATVEQGDTRSGTLTILRFGSPTVRPSCPGQRRHESHRSRSSSRS